MEERRRNLFRRTRTGADLELVRRNEKKHAVPMKTKRKNCVVRHTRSAFDSFPRRGGHPGEVEAAADGGARFAETMGRAGFEYLDLNRALSGAGRNDWPSRRRWFSRRLSGLGSAPLDFGCDSCKDKNTVGDFVGAETPNFHWIQLTSTNVAQQVQYQSNTDTKILQRSTGF